ncbi:MAG: GNAT family N-acetyltransferase [Bacteroidia bacterium]
MDSFSFNPFPALTTERLILRQLSNDDVDDIFRLRADERVSRYIFRIPSTKTEEAKAFIEKINKGIDNNEWGYWAIALKSDNKLIGTACIWNISKENHRAEIGYELIPDFHGKGLMQETLPVLLDFGFNTMNLHSIEAVVNPKNIPSIKLLEKFSFVREAFFKENVYYNGMFLDTAVYSLLSSSYKIISGQ